MIEIIKTAEKDGYDIPDRITRSITEEQWERAQAILADRSSSWAVILDTMSGGEEAKTAAAGRWNSSLSLCAFLESKLLP